MSDEKKRRMEQLAEYIDKIPTDKQEGIVTGIKMVAAVFENQKKSA